MKTLSKAQLTKIANEVLATSVEFDGRSTMKRIVRNLMIEAMQMALAAVQDDIVTTQTKGT